MAFKIGPINLNSVAQGVGGLVFGSGDADEQDGAVERLLECVANGVLADDRRSALAELRDLLQDNPAAQSALGHMGLPVLMAVLKEEREDVEMVRGSLEVLINGLQATEGGEGGGGGKENTPARINAELFARETAALPLLLSLLEEEDFYVRYHAVQLLTLLLNHCPERLQDAVLATPGGVTRLMDMMGEREVIRNEALLLLVSLTRANAEIQKIAAFEGAFERLLVIIAEEGGSDGGVVVQDCCELLSSLLRANAPNQVLLRETLGLRRVVTLLQLRGEAGAQSLPRQKAAVLLSALETVALLLLGPEAPTNAAALAAAAAVEALCALALEGRVGYPAVRAAALRCLGSLVSLHPGSATALGSLMAGAADGRGAEPALSRLLVVALRSGVEREAGAAEEVFRCFCAASHEGQTMLASTITPMPQGGRGGGAHAEDEPASFGSMLVGVLVGEDMAAGVRAAAVLAHVLRGNAAAKELLLRIPLELPASALAPPPETLMPRTLRVLAASAEEPRAAPQLQPLLLRLLVLWLAECPLAVAAFLEAPQHLPLVAGLIKSGGSSRPGAVHTAGLASLLLGCCLLYHPDGQEGAAAGRRGVPDAATVLDMVAARVGLSALFGAWEAMEGSAAWVAVRAGPGLPPPLTRATAAALATGDVASTSGGADSHGGAGAVDWGGLYDGALVAWAADAKEALRARVVDLYARPQRREVAEVGGAGRRREGEVDGALLARLQALVPSLEAELQDLRARNSALAADLLGTRGEEGASAAQAEMDALRTEVQAGAAAKVAVAAAEAEAARQQALAVKLEGDLRSLSDAYNALEADNYRLEGELSAARSQGGADTAGAAEGGGAASEEALAAAREAGRAEAREEAEQELNDLLVCLGQEEAKVEKLRERLEELGEDVDVLIAAVGGGGGVDDEDEGGEDEGDGE